MKPTFYVPVGKVISFREKPQTPKMHTKWGVIAIEALDGEAYTFQLFGDMFLFFMNNGSVGDYVTISGIIRDFVYRDGLNHGTSLQPTYIGILRSFFVAESYKNTAKKIREKKQPSENKIFPEIVPPDEGPAEDFNIGD